MALQQVKRNDGKQKSEQTQDQTVCFLNNNTRTNMTRLSSHAWDDYGSLTSVPDTIPVGPSLTAITHDKGTLGCKGAAKYTVSGPNNEEYAVILGWHASPVHHQVNAPNRVFIQCGTKAEIEGVDWDVIRGKIDSACNAIGVTEENGKFRGEATIEFYRGSSGGTEVTYAALDCDFKNIE